MSTILTILVYFALGSVLVFIIGVAIQTLQNRSKSDSNQSRRERQRKGDQYREKAE